MTERPILFTAFMVRALFDGSKTQTRRVFKRSKEWPVNTHHATMLETRGTALAVDSQRQTHAPEIKCPYGMPADRLWVRETWYCDDYRVQRGPYLLPPDQNVDTMREDGTLVYRADGAAPYEQEQPVWKPSIHMPRWASRITLEITGVRVERLQDISADDAFNEGIKITLDSKTKTPLMRVSGKYPPAQYIDGFGLAIAEYASLWESINGPGSWSANPWVWVVEFKVIKK